MLWLCALAAGFGLTRSFDLPLHQRVPAELYFAWESLRGLLFADLPDTPDGMQVERFHELPDTTVVGLDLAPNGDVFLATSHRQSAGISDNRFKEYWLLDDLAAEHVDDRRAYIEKWAERGKDPLSWYTSAPDVVLRLRDTSGDGRADQVTRLAHFQDVLTGILSSVLVRGADVYATVIPDLWRLRDTDGDGVAEEKERLAHGFGVTTSLGGHDLHGLIEGPDGRIYFSMGDRGYHVRTREGRVLRPPLAVSRGAVFRMQPDGSELEVFATGLRNPQDLAFDDFGNLFTADNNADGIDAARLVHVVEGSDSGWAMPFQSMDAPDYFHGPWEAERLWERAHEGQPAWVHPPIGYLARGPAGIAFDPGLGGLHARHRGRLWIADYQYAASRSGIHAVAIEPEGAGFRAGEPEKLFSNLLPTDLAFSAEGAFWVTHFSQVHGDSAVLRFSLPEHQRAAAVVALATLLRDGLEAQPRAALLTLLAHEDRRARSAAQRELVRRDEAEALGALARDPAAPRLARVHALWGIGQLGADAMRRAGIESLAWTRHDDPEVRAQALRLAGEARAEALAAELIAALAPHETPRSRGFAAQALGRLRHAPALPALVEMLRDNADRDVVLRLRAVHALEKIGDLDALIEHAADPASAVRRGVLLVLRRHRDPRIARFLTDPEPSLVVEAARAIYDAEIPDALPALAALAGTVLPLRDEERQSSHALHRRVIHANLALGGTEHADALAAHAADASNPPTMRREALEALAHFRRPPPREAVFGRYQDLPGRAPERVAHAFDRLVPALLGTPFEARALEVALENGRVPLPDPALLERIAKRDGDPALKRASLRVLRERTSPQLEAALELALADPDPLLRADARDALAAKHPEAALDSLQALDAGAPLEERQRALATLAQLAMPAADAALRSDLVALQQGGLEPGLALDLLEAARARGTALTEELAHAEAVFPAGDPVGARAWALEGGDPALGRRVFEGKGDCLRCHTRGGEGAGRAGPDLSGIGRRARRNLLESVVDPQAEIVSGYGSLELRLATGETLLGVLVAEDTESLHLARGGDTRRVARRDVLAQSAPASAMPPMGLALPPRDLRDLIAYLATL